jgi:hypothetical protein
MEIKHNGALVATIGDVTESNEVSSFLIANGLNIPEEELELVYTGEEAREARQRAYSVESDLLYMEWQYDNTPEKEQAWRDKVTEIKARYPLPTE